jgi:hypothetical protein
MNKAAYALLLLAAPGMLTACTAGTTPLEAGAP